MSRWPVVALTAVLGAAFLVQATSTWRLGERHHLADLALPALVVLLEVGSITAAAIFFSARSKGLRVRSLLMLAITAGLGGLGGVVAYGFAVGIPVAVLMLGLVEVVGAYRRETTTVTQDNQDDQPEPVRTAVQPEPQWSGPDTVELPRLPDTRPVELDQPEPAGPRLQSVRTGGAWSVDQIVADLRERGKTDTTERGFQRYIRDNYSAGADKANKAIAALRTQEMAS